MFAKLLQKTQAKEREQVEASSSALEFASNSGHFIESTKVIEQEVVSENLGKPIMNENTEKKRKEGVQSSGSK